MIAANSANTNAVKSATKPLIMKPRKTAEPAYLAATPVSVNTPDPIVFPNPSITREYNPYVALNFFCFFFLIGLSSNSSFPKSSSFLFYEPKSPVAFGALPSEEYSLLS